MNNSQYLDAISAPSSGKGMKKKPTAKRHEQTIEISDDSDAPEEEASRVSQKRDGGQVGNAEETR